MTLEVDVDDDVPFGFGHVDDDAVAQDAGIVHQDVEIAERLDGLIDESLGAFPVGHVVAVDNRVAPRRLDVFHGLLRGSQVGASPLLITTEVVDHDPGSFVCEQQRMFPAEATPRSGDDRHPAVQCTHRSSPPRRERRETT